MSEHNHPAPNDDYWHRNCFECHHEFFGPKRESLCAVCRPIRNAQIATTPPAAPVAASQGEEGREVPKAEAWRVTMGYSVKTYDLLQDAKAAIDHWLSAFPSGHVDDPEPMMTVAQHERIVAAKDAEIAWLKTDLPGGTVADRLDRLADHSEPGSQRQSDLYAAATVWRKHLSAQPAHLVGGDEREAIKEFKALGFDFGPATPDEMNKPQEIEKLVSQINAMHQQENTAAQRAALTPAAVVMPKRPGDFYLHEPGYQRGWVAHQIEIARLNRRAIPVGLLERIVAPYGANDYPSSIHAHVCAVEELRALLGKGGE